MNNTYYQRTIFDLECDGCGCDISKGKIYAIEYIDKRTGHNINVLEAYELRGNEKESKIYCLACRPNENIINR